MKFNFFHIFFRHFQGKKKKKLNSNSSHYIKPFEIKIYRFGDRNHKNDIFLSLQVEI